jgi:hypothetical protein
LCAIRSVSVKTSVACGGEAAEGERQKSFEALRDRLLAIGHDLSDEDYRVRTITQAELEESGLEEPPSEESGSDEERDYTGSKWGRYLRSTETLYSLQKRQPTKFVPLRTLAEVRRGATTNCDDFFIVSDISQESLDSVTELRLFRSRYGVERRRVESNEILIVRRKDGVELALEARYLRPIIKTARDINRFSTRHIDHDFAVFIPEDRDHLSRLAQAYVEAGEREGWNHAVSFEAIQEAGGNWYTLRESKSAPILLIKTMQYSPFVLWNEGEFLVNQRLYNLTPFDDVDTLALCAILNSTLFACERYAAVKALGREAAIDVEVFSANAYRTPNVRNLGDADINSLREAMQTLAGRKVGAILEEYLSDANYSTAIDYASRQQVERSIWPSEFLDPAREKIDRIVLGLVGVPDSEINQTRKSIINELLSHTRKLKILELEAQINRQGQATKLHPSTRTLADTIWTHIINDGKLQQRQIPEDFLPSGIETRVLKVPSGRSSIEHPSLFDPHERFIVRVGQTTIGFESLEEATYFSTLSNYGVGSSVKIPLEPEVCALVLSEIREYHSQFSTLFLEEAADVTSDVDFQRRIVKEGWKRLIERR